MIKNIIFDFGDIFINLDKQATFAEMAKLGVTKISDEMIGVYHQYEKGLMTTDEFIDFFYKKFEIPKADLVYAWNAILLDFPKKRLDFLKELSESKKYRLFLLSNTNDLHIKWVQDSLGEVFYNTFEKSFEQFYLSHEINFRKPDSEIYEFVLNANNLVADETLFVDDLKENTDSANKLGIHVWNLIPKKEDVTELFTKNKIN
ncbi:HAD family phosphatase [Polaribacter sp. Hel1_33_49]|uniref:HAD family hydrolase n=1 Tax=Polaribacter sp. Hel1_33_49 TaxID=1336803 RepID=UPI00052DCDD3|nr:HAD family phosphatase [Polaribacter sp. Hel1_33_49]KGL61666.1 haloacid dehalogenase-like hydrolase [Polaribacter sp. Hel1_33_49]